MIKDDRCSFELFLKKYYTKYAESCHQLHINYSYTQFIIIDPLNNLA